MHPLGTQSKERWIEQQRAAGWRIVAVELADGAIALPRLEPARQRTVVLLGHEWHGVPEEQVAAPDTCVEIPMVGAAQASTSPSPEASCSVAWPGWREAT